MNNPDAPARPSLPSRRALLVTLATLAAVLAVFELTPLDFWISDHFYDANNGGWMVRHSGLAKTLFYTWPLRLIKMFAVAVLITAFVPHRWLAPRWRLPRRGLAVVFLTLTLVPSLVGSLKAWTGMFCPRHLTHYGGTRPVVGLFESAPEICCGGAKARGRCWPAGHASGGFALMSLCALGRTRRQKIAGVAVGLVAGWTMGLYQMLNGNHYFSHTIITMLLAWLGVLLLLGALKLLRPYRAGHWLQQWPALFWSKPAPPSGFES